MNTTVIVVIMIQLAILFSVISFYVGYDKGFKKSKEIDDQILRELSSKYDVFKK